MKCRGPGQIYMHTDNNNSDLLASKKMTRSRQIADNGLLTGKARARKQGSWFLHPIEIVDFCLQLELERDAYI